MRDEEIGEFKRRREALERCMNCKWFNECKIPNKESIEWCEHQLDKDVREQVVIIALWKWQELEDANTKRNK